MKHRTIRQRAMLLGTCVLAVLWIWLSITAFVLPGAHAVHPLDTGVGAVFGIGTTALLLHPRLTSLPWRIALLLLAFWTWGHWPTAAFTLLPVGAAVALCVLHLAWWPTLLTFWITKTRQIRYAQSRAATPPPSQWPTSFGTQRKPTQPNNSPTYAWTQRGSQASAKTRPSTKTQPTPQPSPTRTTQRPKPSRSRTQPRPAEDLVLDSHAWMHGTPGQSLQSSSSALGAENTRVGILGERRFAKALESAGMLDRFTTFWSLHLPDTDGAGNVDAGMSKYDIDCIIQTQDQIWLIDVKLWTKATLLGEQTKAKPLMKQALWRVITMIRRWGFSHRYRVNACLVLMPADGIAETDLAIQDLDLGLGKHVEVLRLAELLQRLAGSKPYGDTVDEKLLTYRFIDLLKPVPKSG